MKRIIIVTALFLLASCGPPQAHYDTRYQIVPPATQAGQYCATSCVSTQQTCQQNCSIAQEQCLMQKRQEADQRYQDYVAERQRLGRELKETRDSFYYNDYVCTSAYSQCQQTCQSNYQQCHVSCGGQVIPQTVCTFNCHLAAPTYQRY